MLYLAVHMAKQRNNGTKSDSLEKKTAQDHLAQLDQPEFWDICDPSDQVFWEEFFQIEELLDFHDELDPATFSITVQNHKTGQTRSYPHIRLQSARKKVRC
jgi:hypothetical protein